MGYLLIGALNEKDILVHSLGFEPYQRAKMQNTSSWKLRDFISAVFLEELRFLDLQQIN